MPVRTRPGPVPDLVRPGLRILFCGINPGRRSAEMARHFAGPSNRFWKVLHQSGLTPELVHPSDQEVLLDYGIGITNLVARSTTAAAELSPEELRAGLAHLRRSADDLGPAVVAVLGVQAYRLAFRIPKAVIGRQPDDLGGSALWVLPNPSGLQAHYSLSEMVRLFRQMADDAPPRTAGPSPLSG